MYWQAIVGDRNVTGMVLIQLDDDQRMVRMWGVEGPASLPRRPMQLAAALALIGDPRLNEWFPQEHRK